MHNLYFDNAATTAIDRDALQCYLDTSEHFTANPSSTHPMGVMARERLEKARGEVAEILGVKSENIYFTSGGTESNAIVLQSLLLQPSAGRILMNGSEHSANREYSRVLEKYGWNIDLVSSNYGKVNLEKFASRITKDTRMVVFMNVNNVLGNIFDIKSLVSIVREKEKEFGKKIHFHMDGVQSLGKIRFDLGDLDVDSAAFSSHKFKGPRGIGILYNRDSNICAISRGGGQERGLRPGTENLPAICAMTCALRKAYDNFDRNYEHACSLNRYFRENCKAKVYTPAENSTPYVLNISTYPYPSEVFSRLMAEKGFCVSAGSACSNNARTKGGSPLLYLGVKAEDVKFSARISFSYDTEMDDLKELVEHINTVLR